MSTVRSGSIRPLLRVLLLLATLLGLAAVPPVAQASSAATPFKVLALYSGTYDAAHIDFDKEANAWFPQQAAANGFTYTASTNWDLLANGGVNAYQVVLFLDDLPQTSAQRSGFEAYMRGGGGFMGFHVSAFTTDAASWSWYHNTFLGSGNFASNTWGPTAVTLKVEDHTNAATANLPPRSPRRSASGTAGPGICGRTPTSRSWPRSTPAVSRSARTPTSPGTAAITRSCGPTRSTECCTRTSATTR